MISGTASTVHQAMSRGVEGSTPRSPGTFPGAIPRVQGAGWAPVRVTLGAGHRGVTVITSGPAALATAGRIGDAVQTPDLHSTLPCIPLS